MSNINGKKVAHTLLHVAAKSNQTRTISVNLMAPSEMVIMASP